MNRSVSITRLLDCYFAVRYQDFQGLVSDPAGTSSQHYWLLQSRVDRLDAFSQDGKIEIYFLQVFTPVNTDLDVAEKGWREDWMILKFKIIHTDGACFSVSSVLHYCSGSPFPFPSLYFCTYLLLGRNVFKVQSWTASDRNTSFLYA